MRSGVFVFVSVFVMSAALAHADGDQTPKDPYKAYMPADAPASAPPAPVATPPYLASAPADGSLRQKARKLRHARAHWRSVPLSTREADLAASMSSGGARYTAAEALAPIWAGFSLGADTGLDIGSSGAVGVGLRGGYDMQFDNAVAGIRLAANFGAGGASRNANWTGDPQGATAYEASGSGASHFLGTAAGRFGWSIGGSALPYVEGGLALANVSTTSSIAAQGPTFGAVVGQSSGSALQAGGVIGVGLEFMLVPGWSLDLELRDILIPNATRTASIQDSNGFTKQNAFSYGAGGAQLLMGANARF